MSATEELVKTLSDSLKKTFVQIHQAVVDSVNAATSEATVRVSDSATSVLAKYVTYVPTAGETVFVLQEEEDVLVWGKIGAGGYPTGGITGFCSSTPPVGWLLCNGQSTSGYPALAAVAGANVPDLRNKFVVGAGSTYGQGATGGADTVALTTANLASHTHTGPDHQHSNPAHQHGGANGQSFLTDGGTNADITRGGGQFQVHSSTATASFSTLAAGAGATGSAGSGTAHENRPPYYALTYIIKT